jgi:hypothetical protein
MQMKFLAAATALVMALFPAHAHAPKVGIHGGPQVDAGSFHVEIIPQGTVLQVYFRDHSDKVVSTQGWKGIAIFTISLRACRPSRSPQNPRAPCGSPRRAETPCRPNSTETVLKYQNHGCNLDPLARALRSPLR